MRHLVLVLMIALLPFRSWASDALVTHMAVQLATASVITAYQVPTAQEMTATAKTDHQSHAMPDCHQSAKGSLGADTREDTTAKIDQCGTCQACQACHTVALSPSQIHVFKSLTSPQLRPAVSATFTSAAIALGQKPPIS